MAHGLRLASALTVSLLVSACAGGASKALDTYDLSVPSVAEKGRRNADVQILVAEPQALKALDSESIVVRTGPSSIEYLGGAQWGDRLPKIVQARLVQAFENSGRFGGVGRPGEGLAIDNQIITDIRAFEVRAEGQNIATVEISAKLLNDRNGVVIASKVFKSTVSAGAGPDAFVRALDTAFDTAASEIVLWAAGKI
ncbi:MAG: ABC-type transport auxiliary lipoprotein family protein [Rhizobiaceae bacterium]